MKKRSETDVLADQSRKKRRSLTRSNLSNVSKRRIEDLPVELWWNIFSYIDGESLLNSFNNLNGQINNILFDVRFSIHFNVDRSNWSTLSKFHPNQIDSLTIDYHQFTRPTTIDPSRFSRLRSLSLVNIEEDQLQVISDSLQVPLNYFSIESKCAKYLSRILLIYFPTVPKVKVKSKNQEFIVKVSDRQTRAFSSVEHLLLDGRLKLARIYRLWTMVPKLRSLSTVDGGLHQGDYWIDDDLIRQSSFPERLFTLRIRIFDDDFSFNNLQGLIPATLRSLSISGSLADDDLQDYLSSENWRRLISRSSSQNLLIRIDLSSHFDPGDIVGLQKTLNRFRNDSFFRHVNIRSKQFFVTIRGSIGKIKS